MLSEVKGFCAARVDCVLVGGFIKFGGVGFCMGVTTFVIFTGLTDADNTVWKNKQTKGNIIPGLNHG